SPPAPVDFAQFAVQPDGKTLLAASNIRIPGTTNRIVRLNVDGSVDSAFQPALPDRTILRIATLADGKVLAHLEDNSLFRLLPNGALDPSFHPPSGLTINQFFPVPGDKILILDRYYNFYTSHSQLIRLNPDGSVDETYHAAVDQISFVFPLQDGRRS